ncbi:hypothetical protein HanIR_Chr10g0450841 [Helianthus annuus]|nr:hypothetical protein HanIR_Chr10g0450841 [Helianthus annuus]
MIFQKSQKARQVTIFFKFTSEAGLTAVLENGPWLVNNVPIILNKWEPGLCLQRVEPKSIPIWVTVHDVPMELWTKRGMSIVFSGVGKPLLMDKVTQARVVNKTGKLGYARMLVDAQAEFKLPNQVEVEFPSGPNGESRIGVLEVTYQWKPQVCGHCVVFGHSTKLCKHQMTIVEPTAEVVMKAVNNQTQHSVPKGSRDVDDEFTKVTHKKKTSNFNPNDEKTEDHNSGKGSNTASTSGVKKWVQSGVKKGGSGFNFGRAVQGLCDQRSAAKQPSKPAVRQAQSVVKRLKMLL